MDKTNSEKDRQVERERKERRRGRGGGDRKGGFLYRRWGGGRVGPRARRDYSGGASVRVPVCMCVLHTCLRICSSQEANSCKNPFPPSPYTHTEIQPHTGQTPAHTKGKNTHKTPMIQYPIHRCVLKCHVHTHTRL